MNISIKHGGVASILSLVFSLCAAPAISGCAAASHDENVEGGDDALFLGTNVQLWTQNANTVPLCWYTPGYAREKSIIQTSIAKTWEKATNIHTTWREGCPTTGGEKLVKVQIGKHTQVPDGHGGLYWDHSTDGQTRGLGMAALSTPQQVPPNASSGNGMTIWVEDGGTSTQQRMEYVAVHEFGHVLGFQHEQDRNETEARACGPAGTGGTPVGPYDKDSIMNYCNSYGNNVGFLSEGDVMNVRSIYGFKPALGQFFGDLNRDGKADALAVNGGGTYALTSNGSHLGGFARVSFPFYGSRETLVADVNGDGRVDTIAVNNKALFVMTSDGTQMTNWGQWTTAPFYGSRKTLAADINGDGKADVIAVNNKGLFVMLSDGTKFTGWAEWSATPFYGTLGTYAGDVNGDGKADIIAVSGDATRVMLSDGTKFTGGGSWSGPFYGNLSTSFADVTGDGKIDAIAVSDSGVYVMTSDGASFGNYRVWSPFPFYGTRETAFADLDGDGKADAIAVNNKGDFVMTSTGKAFAWSGQWSDPFYSQP